MFKKFNLCDVSSVEDDNAKETNWELCILCQKETPEELTCPGRSLRPDKCVGYSKLADNLEEFERISRVPLAVNVQALNDGAGLKETFVARGAKWHKSCYLELSSSRLERAKKRRSSEAIEVATISPVKTRTRKESYIPDCCLFCGLPGTRSKMLSRVSTEHCSKEIYDTAKKLKDTQILSKLAGASDSMAHTLKAVYHNRCRVNYLDRLKRAATSQDKTGLDRAQAHGLALAGLVSYMKSEREISDDPPVFS